MGDRAAERVGRKVDAVLVDVALLHLDAVEVDTELIVADPGEGGAGPFLRAHGDCNLHTVFVIDQPAVEKGGHGDQVADLVDPAFRRALEAESREAVDGADAVITVGVQPAVQPVHRRLFAVQNFGAAENQAAGRHGHAVEIAVGRIHLVAELQLRRPGPGRVDGPPQRVAHLQLQEGDGAGHGHRHRLLEGDGDSNPFAAFVDLAAGVEVAGRGGDLEALDPRRLVLDFYGDVEVRGSGEFDIPLA